MHRFSVILLVIIAFLLSSVYFLPVWDISLEAPQYPEGLGMQIWLSKITGDLNTINGLNHYIGMKKIEPGSIKELTYMPYLMVSLILLSLITAFSGNKKFLLSLTIVFLLFGIAGGIDFYLWEYDYGHDLDSTAAIKVPGMSYQPPLFGSKKLLNFVAHSYPAEGGYIIILSGIAVVLLSVYETFIRKTKK